MSFRIVLLSGSVASGKTTLWQKLLIKTFPTERIHVLKTKDLIRELASKKLRRDLPSERRALQDFGDQLDKDTNGTWVRDALVSLVNTYVSMETSPIFIVDAVRIERQIKAIREAYGVTFSQSHSS